LRVAAVPDLLPDLAAVLSGVEKTNVNDGFQIQHAADLYERLYPFLEGTPCARRLDRPMDGAVEQFRADLAPAVLGRVRVGYVGTDRPRPKLGLVEEGDPCRPGRVHILRNPTALPRAYVVPRAEVASPFRASASYRLSKINPREAVMMGRDPLPPGDR